MSSTEPAAEDATTGEDAAHTAERLAEAFRRIHRERMAGLPILHPHLEVAVVGGRRWQGHWLGVLVTPWCMNLVLVPAAGSALAQDAGGTTRLLDFPAGRFELTASDVDGVGAMATCSLFSPMHAFADQAAAEATALEVMTELFEPTAPGAAPSPGAGSADAEVQRGGGVSRRDLLRGTFRRR
ncbi:MAG: [NiFe]-hydrogenase assembly chaperone HybE [Gammaproteobacteria bacterium]|nr:[NiFe]-hydrogenase assembly chaperone HybE [Gammaproteobacteria bacterium]